MSEREGCTTKIGNKDASSSLLREAAEILFLKDVASPSPGGGWSISFGTLRILSSSIDATCIRPLDVVKGTDIVVADIIGVFWVDVLWADENAKMVKIE